MTTRVWVDGSTEEICFVIDGTIREKKVFIPLNRKVTNNEGEYLALLLCLQELRDMGIEDVAVYSDSELIVHQVNSELDPSYTPYYSRYKPSFKNGAKKAVELMKLVRATLSWLPREENRAGIILEEHQKAQRSVKNKQIKEEK